MQFSNKDKRTKKINSAKDDDEEEIQKYLRVTSSFWVGVSGKILLVATRTAPGVRPVRSDQT